MPRKKNATKKQAKPTTYFKAKNGRFYKKIQVDGKTRCRFVSNSEAMGKVSAKKSKKVSKAKVDKPIGSSSPMPPIPAPAKPPLKRTRRRKLKKENDVSSVD